MLALERIFGAAAGLSASVVTRLTTQWQPAEGRTASLRHGAWTLHWADRNRRWLRYPDLDPSPRLEDLLAEIDRDPAGVFWG